mgnify:CR=1 FL=1
MKHKLLFNIFVVSFITLFCILGTWQLYRLQWKQDLISQIDRGLKSAPIRYSKDIDKDYQRVILNGEYNFKNQIYLYSLNHKGKPGFDVITPFKTNGAIDFDAIKRKLDRLSGNNTSRNTMWKPTEGEKHSVRLLSFPDNDGQPFKELMFYYNIPGQRGLLAPSQFGKRDPIQELINKLRDEGTKESYEMAKQAIDLGFFISFSGIITFKNAESLRDTVKKVPIENILIETDSPYLAPVPNRGKLNEPANVRYVAEKIAELKGISIEEVAEITTNNFFNLFRKCKTL